MPLALGLVALISFVRHVRHIGVRALAGCVSGTAMVFLSRVL